jgi:hypothetical protein
MFRKTNLRARRCLLALALLAAGAGIAVAQDPATDRAQDPSAAQEESTDAAVPPESEAQAEPPRGIRPAEMPPLPKPPPPLPLKAAPRWEDIEDEENIPGQPVTRVRIAVLNATGRERGANQVALLLDTVRRRPLENRIGMMIEVVNISAGAGTFGTDTVVYYRPGFLRPALILAQAIPGQTRVESMRTERTPRAGVDVEVVVNRALP